MAGCAPLRVRRFVFAAAALLGATPAFAAAPPDAPAATPIDVLTYHYDDARTGWNPHETALTPQSVASSAFGLLQTIPVDGDVLAQPLFVSGLRLPDHTVHDLVVIATETNHVYAIDAATGTPAWQVDLGPPQSSADLGCGQVHPNYGISATPVIVRSPSGRATLYLVSATEPAAGEFHTWLHALDMADGSDVHAPREIAAQVTLDDGSTLAYSPADQWVRAGLAQAGGDIVVAVTTHCESRSEDRVAGWLLRYDDQLRQTAAFSTILTRAGLELASIWQSGFAPAVDADGSVFAVTGNGNFSHGGRDWGESVLRMAPGGKHVTDFFTPATYRSMNKRDADFGSGGVMLVPVRDGQVAPPMAVAMGKDHVLYLLDRNALGRVHAGDTGALQAQQLAGDGVWGGPCYWLGPGGGLVYYQAADDVLRAYALDTGAVPSLTETAHGSIASPFGGSLPVVSSHGSQAGTGVVWAINRHIPQSLQAYDAQALGDPIFTATLPRWMAGSAFITPLQANGRVWVGTSGAVLVFGLK